MSEFVTRRELRLRRDAEIRRPHRGARHDIQALRAIAVVLVILNHVFDRPTGGYVGVDVFFVISGFLITSQLVREQARTGTVSLTAFYQRRIRRIAPASLVTLAVTVMATLVVIGPSRMRDVAGDAIWAALSLANWHYAAIGTDYSSADGPVSPLQHFWSLAVEEQFYVVWPLIIIGVGIISTRSRRLLVVCLTIMAVVSLGWSVNQTSTSPTVAYFSTFTRVWELAVGAVLALVAHRAPLIPRRWRPLLAGIGLVGIIVPAFAFTTDTPFPSGWAAIPVLATALVILSGTGIDTPSALPFLGRREIQYVGDISFSLYLWHFPLTVLAAQVVAVGGVGYPITVLVGTAILSIASYHLIEQPIRRSSWLSAFKPRRRRQRRRLFPAMSGVLVVATVIGAVATVAVPHVPATSAPVEPDALATTSDPASVLDSQIADAVSATTWPALTPNIDGAKEDASPFIGDLHCFNSPKPTNGQQCTKGSPAAPKLAIVVGDSVAASWTPGIVKALGPDWRVHVAANPNCPFIDSDIEIADDLGSSAACNARRAAVTQQIVDQRPDLVFISDLEYGVGRLANPPADTAGVRDRWIGARTAMIRTVQESAGKVVLFSPNPIGKAAADCSTAGRPPSNCLSGQSRQWKAKAAYDRTAADDTGVTFVDTSRWFCTSDGQCPAFVGDMLVRWDRAHITETYSRYLAPLIRQKLLAT